MEVGGLQQDRHGLESVIPGLGHLYKHHNLAGAGILILGNALVWDYHWKDFRRKVKRA